MKEPIEYVGYNKKILQNGEVIEAIVITSNPEEFNGEFLPITSEFGEGSISYNLKKLKGGLTK